MSFFRRRAPVYLDELAPAVEASEAEQPEATTMPEAPMTLERLRTEHPELVAEIQAEARADRAALLEGAREQGCTAGREQGRVEEHARLMSILTHPAAQGRMPLALRLARMPMMTVADAATLLAGMKKALTPDEEFAAVLAKCGPAPIDEQTELEAYLARMKALDAEDLATRAVLAQARAVERR